MNTFLLNEHAAGRSRGRERAGEERTSVGRQSPLRASLQGAPHVRAAAQLQRLADQSPRAQRLAELQSSLNRGVTQLRRVRLKDGQTINTEEHTEQELRQHLQEHMFDERPDAAVQLSDSSAADELEAAIEAREFRIEDAVPRETQQTQAFEHYWQGQRDDEYNRQHPNWLPPTLPGLKGKALNEYMKLHDGHFPKVEVSTADELHHFTTDEGAEGMRATQQMYPSVTAGIQTTHYGRGVYFSDRGPADLAAQTHEDVTRAIYTKDSAENRRRSRHLASVDVSDLSVLKLSLRDRAPVFMHPTEDPIDVRGRLEINETSSLVRPDIPPAPSRQSGASSSNSGGAPRRFKPPSAPK
jgi:hypothetical protein